jgi:hypothetical protein
VPDGTPEPLAELAGEALETVAEVMRGRVRTGGFERLQASRIVREEICGKVADKLEHQVRDVGEGEITDEEWAELARLRHEVRGG